MSKAYFRVDDMVRGATVYLVPREGGLADLTIESASEELANTTLCAVFRMRPFIARDVGAKLQKWADAEYAREEAAASAERPDVPRLRVAKPVPNHELADRLRSLLARVESGELQSLTWIGELADGSVLMGHEWEAGLWPSKMIGELALYQQKLGLAELERRREIERT